MRFWLLYAYARSDKERYIDDDPKEDNLMSTKFAQIENVYK